MRRLLLTILILALVGDLLAAVWLGRAVIGNRRWMIEAREAVFARFVSDPAELAAPPDALRRAGFRGDPPELIAEWSERLPREVEWLRDVPADLAGRSEIEIVKALVPLFSKNGGGGCGDYRDLLDNVQRLPRGDGLGCCSDHVQVLIAIGSTLGLFVRQVHHTQHTMAEVWVPALSAWVFVDPHYALMARDPDGHWLSLLGIRERYLRGEPVVFEFIGNRHHLFATTDPHQHALYDEAADFEVLKLTWGNNVFEEDRLDRRLAFLPRPARQGVGLLAGVLPRPRLLADEDAPGVLQLQRRRPVYLLVGASLAAGTLVPAFVLWRLGPRRRRRGVASARLATGNGHR